MRQQFFNEYSIARSFSDRLHILAFVMLNVFFNICQTGHIINQILNNNTFLLSHLDDNRNVLILNIYENVSSKLFTWIYFLLQKKKSTAFKEKFKQFSKVKHKKNVTTFIKMQF